MSKSARNFLFGSVFAVFFILSYFYISSPQQKKAEEQIVSSTPTPTAMPPKISEVHSEDGTKKVTMQADRGVNGLTIYSFYVSDVDGSNKQFLFTKSLGSSDSLWSSQNSWSPNNKLLFISQNLNGQAGALVFNADGKNFANGSSFLDVGALFLEKVTDYKLSDVTGWDSSTLLHVFTMKDSSTRGPSFWFDTDSASFIQLASH